MIKYFGTFGTRWTFLVLARGHPSKQWQFRESFTFLIFFLWKSTDLFDLIKCGVFDSATDQTQKVARQWITESSKVSRVLAVSPLH